MRTVWPRRSVAASPSILATPIPMRSASSTCPGHERFVHTMLAGASGVDAALLVVALNDGVMPQTREHVQILQLLGIDRGVVALTKSDLAPARDAESPRR